MAHRPSSVFERYTPIGAPMTAVERRSWTVRPHLEGVSLSGSGDGQPAQNVLIVRLTDTGDIAFQVPSGRLVLSVNDLRRVRAMLLDAMAATLWQYGGWPPVA